MNTFFTTSAANTDLKLLFDLRDGVVHAGFDEALEERLLVAFVKHADACLSDLTKDRAASSLQPAKARFAEKFGEFSARSCRRRPADVSG